VVERPHAVKKLAQLCGPADPASPGACGLRSFGRSRVDNDVRLPGAASAAAAWRALWAAAPLPAQGASAALMRGTGRTDAGAVRDLLRAAEAAHVALAGLRVRSVGDAWEAVVAARTARYRWQDYCPHDSVVVELPSADQEFVDLHILAE